MEKDAYFHRPVLLKEVLKYLNPHPPENIVDATLGGGGYSREILANIGLQGKLLAIDLDFKAVELTRKQAQKSKHKNWLIVQGNFRNIDKIVHKHKFQNIAGIVADIGLSSYQLDQAGRGMSFQKNEILDMRFNQVSEEIDAKYIVNHYEETQLRQIFENYGEEKFSRQIARKIIEYRTLNPRPKVIKYTSDLYEIIVSALPKPVKHKADDSARRIFQALRIAVNHELENLTEFLPKAFNLLVTGGRLVVVSFHSLEDRIVKQYFLALSQGCVCPIDFPLCICGKNPQGKILTKKPVIAEVNELNQNPRARPAKLRAIIKL